jgi:hypothetical protein
MRNICFYTLVVTIGCRDKTGCRTHILICAFSGYLADEITVCSLAPECKSCICLEKFFQAA